MGFSNFSIRFYAKKRARREDMYSDYLFGKCLQFLPFVLIRPA
jgi:hypothetical protein